jgi:hypothetical protein
MDDRRPLDARAKELVDLWNARRAAGADVWMYPTVTAALAAGCPWLHFCCTLCQRQDAVDLRTFPQHRTASVSSVISELACTDCQQSGDIRLFRLSPTRSVEPPLAQSEALAEPSFLFVCPVTGTRVKGFVVTEMPSDDPNSFEPVSCLACGRMHLLNFKTRKTVGEDRAESGTGRKDRGH